MNNKVILALALSCCWLAGCAAAPTLPLRQDRVDHNIWRVYDDQADVVCWIYANSYQGGISCLPLTATDLDK